MEKYFNITKDGFSVRSKIYCNSLDAVKRVVIYMHGFASNLDTGTASRFASLLLKKNKDAALISFNLPAHGGDALKLTLQNCKAYMELAADYAKETFKTDKIYAFGTSFGGYLTLSLIYENGSPFEKTALRSPAVNMHESLSQNILDQKSLKALKNNKPASVGFGVKVKITNSFLNELKENDIRTLDFTPFSHDILIIHGTKDEIVPFEESKSFAEKNGISFVPIDGADHRVTDPLKMDKAIKAIIDYFEFSS
ncbi:MAG: prolyl oligopeptidase family serine peptidase [Clostridia bacterium]|nr:prolyl oligopeptidase family serine peptidase [Clostridia bacterium]